MGDSSKVESQGTHLKVFIRNLSAPAELLLVTLICFGWPILRAGIAIRSHWNHPIPDEIEFGPAIIIRSAILELLSLAATLWIGTVRGWPFATFGLRLSWKGTAAGVLLFTVTLAVSSLGNSILNNFFHVVTASRLVGATLPFAILASVVNPLFEEVLEAGYSLRALRDLGMWTAVLASALFVGFLHAYRGMNGAVGVVIIRIIFGLTYWRWRQLWPLIFAHSLLDLLALANR